MIFRKLVLPFIAAVVALAATTPAPAAEDPVVAVVNGAEIRRSDVANAQSMLPSRYREMALGIVFSHLLNELITTELLAQEAREQGIEDNPAFQRKLALAKARLLEQAALDSRVGEKLDDEAVQRRYDLFVQETGRQKEVRARHILLESREDAEAVIAELDGGADFAALARERSTGPSARKGGDLGYFARGDMVPEFSKAAFSLENGTYTREPVRTKFGWHVILAEDRRQKPVPPLSEVESQLREELRGYIEDTYIEELRSGADIQLFDYDGSPLE